jgi:hypothetical protein
VPLFSTPPSPAHRPVSPTATQAVPRPSPPRAGLPPDLASSRSQSSLDSPRRDAVERSYHHQETCNDVSRLSSTLPTPEDRRIAATCEARAAAPVFGCRGFRPPLLVRVAVSISPASPRSPLPFPHLGRARSHSNRRHCRRPVTPCPPVSSGRRRGPSVLHIDPCPS